MWHFGKFSLGLPVGARLGLSLRDDREHTAHIGERGEPENPRVGMANYFVEHERAGPPHTDRCTTARKSFSIIALK